ncbi:MAG: hypothetical protein OXT09_13810, partial [Myxococcales bacterium]|nr:hypothetical protein [Myxococcales bacterium]
AAVARALARYAHEPSVAELVAATERAQRTRDPAALAARARAAGWVPRVTLRARRGQAVDLDGAGDSLRLSTDDDLTLEAALVFELDRLVFRREETAIHRDARAARQLRMALVREVVALYHERRRLQLRRDLAPTRDVEIPLRIAEIEALLDIFTNGAFLAMMADARWRTADSTPATRPRSPQRSSSTETP